MAMKDGITNIYKSLTSRQVLSKDAIPFPIYLYPIISYTKYKNSFGFLWFIHDQS